MSMMTKDGITTFITRPAPVIDRELRLSLYWVITALACLGLVLVVTHDFFGEPEQKLTILPGCKKI